MTPTLSRHFQPTELRGVNPDLRTVDIVASDFTLDSYGTRIDPAGWDLEQFKRNPAICLQHDSWRGMPVANALPETVRIENGKLVMTVKFGPQGTSQNADEAFNLIAAGILRGVSVGFDPSEWEDVEEQEGGYKKQVRVYRKQRLMEVSFVTIPSNDNGMVVRSREQNQDLEQVRGWTVRLEESLEANRKEDDAREQIRAYTPTHLLTCVGYMERKKPANKASTAVLKKFFDARGEEPPADEVEAWNRMEELMGEPEKKADEPVVPPAPEAAPAQQPAPEVKTEEPATPSNPDAPADPERARTASVPISLTVLAALPAQLARSYVDAAVAALQQGVPLKDAMELVDGLAESVAKSFPPVSHE